MEKMIEEMLSHICDVLCEAPKRPNITEDELDRVCSGCKMCIYICKLLDSFEDKRENEPLTPEELKRMVGEPVWCKVENCSWIPKGGYWCLVTKRGIVPPFMNYQPFDCGWEFYKYKPKEVIDE